MAVKAGLHHLDRRFGSSGPSETALPWACLDEWGTPGAALAGAESGNADISAFAELSLANLKALAPVTHLWEWSAKGTLPAAKSYLELLI